MGLSINFLPEEIDKLREAVQVANIQMTRLKSVLKNNGIDIENSETDLNKVLDIFRTKILNILMLRIILIRTQKRIILKLEKLMLHLI